jgi:antitoxin (DNA-binding transcriptional repressor) of toxin-antitoxin stability system
MSSSIDLRDFSEGADQVLAQLEADPEGIIITHEGNDVARLTALSSEERAWREAMRSEGDNPDDAHFGEPEPEVDLPLLAQTTLMMNGVAIAAAAEGDAVREATGEAAELGEADAFEFDAFEGDTVERDAIDGDAVEGDSAFQFEPAASVPVFDSADTSAEEAGSEEAELEETEPEAAEAATADDAFASDSPEVNHYVPPTAAPDGFEPEGEAADLSLSADTTADAESTATDDAMTGEMADAVDDAMAGTGDSDIDGFHASPDVPDSAAPVAEESVPQRTSFFGTPDSTPESDLEPETGDESSEVGADDTASPSPWQFNAEPVAAEPDLQAANDATFNPQAPTEPHAESPDSAEENSADDHSADENTEDEDSVQSLANAWGFTLASEPEPEPVYDPGADPQITPPTEPVPDGDREWVPFADPTPKPDPDREVEPDADPEFEAAPVEDGGPGDNPAEPVAVSTPFAPVAVTDETDVHADGMFASEDPLLKEPESTSEWESYFQAPAPGAVDEK